MKSKLITRLRTATLICACVLPTLATAQQRDHERDREHDRSKPYRNSDVDERSRTQTSDAITPAQFAYEAAWMGLKEVRLGEIAQVKASDSDIREFARKMVEDHGNANNRLRQLSENKGYSLPSTNVFVAANRDDDRDIPKQGLGARRQTEGTRPDSDRTDDNERTRRNRDRDGDGVADRRGRLNDAEQMRRQDTRAVQRLQNLSGSQFDRAYITEMVHDHAKAVSKFRTASETVMDEQVKQFAKDALPILEHHYAQAQQIARDKGWNVERGLGAVERPE